MLEYMIRHKLPTVAWHAISLGITAVMMIGLTLLVYFLSIPNPNMILIAGLIVCEALFGLYAGILAGTEMILYSWFFFSSDKRLFSFNFTEINLYKLLIVALGVFLAVAFIGALTILLKKAYRALRKANEALQADNAKLFYAATRDHLTDIKNRHCFDLEAQGFVGSEVTMMLIDIDRFKIVNDELGHHTGDLALRKLTDALRTLFGEEQCYRYGGDEFVVVSRLDESAFMACLASLRDDLHEIETSEGQRISLTFSAGYVHGFASSEDDLYHMITTCDRLLYQAKRKGRNQWVTSRKHDGDERKN